MVIGKYIRLSQADRDVMKKENKTESESIAHQRDLIGRYISSHEDLKGCEVWEFFDDGYSGTNFRRPSFERLMEQIRRGEVDCVIVKDFSRFGRDYIELGDYLERIFPFLGVRFISVNDGYDSNDYKGTTGGLDVVLKNIVYDFYSKDLSVKVQTAKRAKMRKGEAGGGHVPFGYVRCGSDRKRYVVDPEAAAVVRRIFDLALEGEKTSGIAGALNADCVPTPGQYYRKRHPGTKKFGNLSGEISWTVGMVNRILKNEAYYGAMVGHKREKVTACSRVTRAVDRSEQIIVPGMHEGIVTKEEWEKAQVCIRKVSSGAPAGKRDYPLRSVCRCGHCGRALQFYGKKKGHYFICESSRLAVDAPCPRGKITEGVVNAAVLEAVRGLIKCGRQYGKDLERKRDAAGTRAGRRRKEIADLQAAVRRCQADLFQNSERQMDGLIDRETYQRKREILNGERRKLEERIRVLETEQEQEETAADPETGKFLDAVGRYDGREELDNEMVLAFVEKVLVYDEEHVEIQWNFSDKLMRDVLGSV